jgi:hypothetical protein
MTGKKELLHSIHHFLTAAILITKGIDKIGHHLVIGGLMLLFGVIILGFFIYSLASKQHHDKLELIVRWFEAFVSLLMAYIFFTEEKKFLPYIFLLGAIGFFISIFVFHKNKRQPGK